MRHSNAIKKVIESCFDDERTLVQKSKLVDEATALVLRRLADERHSFLEELERLSSPIGRGSSGSWGALVRELGNWPWAKVIGPRAAIAACRRSQQRTDLRYERALELEWSSELKAILTLQHERVHAARRELAELRS